MRQQVWFSSQICWCELIVTIEDKQSNVWYTLVQSIWIWKSATGWGCTQFTRAQINLNSLSCRHTVICHERSKIIPCTVYRVSESTRSIFLSDRAESGDDMSGSAGNSNKHTKPVQRGLFAVRRFRSALGCCEPFCHQIKTNTDSIIYNHLGESGGVGVGS